MVLVAEVMPVDNIIGGTDLDLIGQHFFSRSLLLFEEVLELEVTDDEAAKTAGPKEI